MHRYLAYIDESGDPIFGEKASKTYIVVAVLVASDELDDIKAAVNNILIKHRLPELKSSRIGSFNKRYAICESLSRLNVKILSIRVDKESLFGDWFKYRNTFYKYIQLRLHRDICRLYNPDKSVIDRYGSPEFQLSFRQYIENKLQKDLFEPRIIIETAKENEFIQISDFIAGTIRKAIEGEFPDNKSIIDLFLHKWPVKRNIPDEGRYIKPFENDDNNGEVAIFIEEVWRYLESNKLNIESPKNRTLEYLYYSALDGENEWLYTNEIIAWLSETGINITEEQFRAEIIASLRDEGLIIVSSRKGLKIPLKLDDLKEYMQFSVNFALPVLRRLKKAIIFVREKEVFPEIADTLSIEMKNILNMIED